MELDSKWSSLSYKNVCHREIYVCQHGVVFFFSIKRFEIHYKESVSNVR